MRRALRVNALVVVAVEFATVTFHASIAFDVMSMLTSIRIYAGQFHFRVATAKVALRVITAVFHELISPSGEHPT